MIQPHNQKAAAMWNSPGAEYEQISRHLSDAIEHAILRLDPRPGERILDVATGTGWAARRAASLGARVVGVDLAADLIETARALAAGAGLEIEFHVGDAEHLDLGDGRFDAVVSTFGVMFAARPEAAAAELARVCRPGGRVALASWTPDSTVARKFQVTNPYLPGPPSGPSPFDWGDREKVSRLLNGAFELRFETGVTTLRLPGPEAAWELFVTSYGPTKALAGMLDPARRDALRRDILAFYAQFRTELGVAVPREYLLVVGNRRTR